MSLAYRRCRHISRSDGTRPSPCLAADDAARTVRSPVAGIMRISGVCDIMALLITPRLTRSILSVGDRNPMLATWRVLPMMVACVIACVSSAARGQVTVNFAVNPTADTSRISPYIYGINWVHGGEPLHADWNLGSRRLGGNRLSNYNWEINASNSGNDCDAACRNQNDNWLTYRLPADSQNVPAILPKTFHRDSRMLGCYSLVQLQAAGYVAGDRNENAGAVAAAPSARWKAVRMAKGSPLATVPDPNDDYVYIDEQVNALVAEFGTAANGGVEGYSVDNEPGLWYTSHPRLRGLSYASAAEVTAAEGAGNPAIANAKAKCEEVIQKTMLMGAAVKQVDPSAQIIGPAWWGFLDYFSLQSAPDWQPNSGVYPTYMAMYLDRMKQASAAANTRLLDVVDLHWYPQVDEVPAKMLQAPRSLWDSTYKEDSWITRDVLGEPINLIPTVRAAIAKYYPGTRFGITEFRFGDADNGNTYYSGIAVADALGIFGRDGVYMAQYHPTDLDAPIEGYVAAAYKIYRNYDGAKGMFGSVTTRATTSDVENSAVYSSFDPAQPGRLHLVVINRNMTQPVDGRFNLGNARAYTSARVFAFDNISATITERTPVASIASNRFSYSIPPLTVAHFVIESAQSDVDMLPDVSGLELRSASPNPFADAITIRMVLPERRHVTLSVVDALGTVVAVLADGVFEPGEHQVLFSPKGAAPSGAYYCRMTSGHDVRTLRLDLVR